MLAPSSLSIRNVIPNPTRQDLKMPCNVRDRPLHAYRCFLPRALCSAMVVMRAGTGSLPTWKQEQMEEPLIRLFRAGPYRLFFSRNGSSLIILSSRYPAPPKVDHPVSRNLFAGMDYHPYRHRGRTFYLSSPMYRNTLLVTTRWARIPSFGVGVSFGAFSISLSTRSRQMIADM